MIAVLDRKGSRPLEVAGHNRLPAPSPNDLGSYNAATGIGSALPAAGATVWTRQKAPLDAIHTVCTLPR
jgi:hypothetical protein